MNNSMDKAEVQKPSWLLLWFSADEARKNEPLSYLALIIGVRLQFLTKPVIFNATFSSLE